MINLLLFLINFNGGIGFSVGYYTPSLAQLNSFLVDNGEYKMRSNYTIGVEARSSFLERFLISADGTWFPSRKSADNKQSLEIKAGAGYFGYRIYLLPALLYFYINGGYELAMVSYKCAVIPNPGTILPNVDSTIMESGIVGGAVVKGSIKFIPTQRLGVELSMGYRFLSSSDILPKNYVAQNDSGGNVPVPLDLSGLFFKVTFLREFGTIVSY